MTTGHIHEWASKTCEKHHINYMNISLKSICHYLCIGYLIAAASKQGKDCKWQENVIHNHVTINEKLFEMKNIAYVCVQMDA